MPGDSAYIMLFYPFKKKSCSAKHKSYFCSLDSFFRKNSVSSQDSTVIASHSTPENI